MKMSEGAKCRRGGEEFKGENLDVEKICDKTTRDTLKKMLIEAVEINSERRRERETEGTGK